MTVLVTADIHLSANVRDAYRHEFMKRFPALAKKFGAELVIILGDLCEEKDAHPAELVNALVDHLYALATVCPVIVLQGNHDYLSSPDNPYFRFLQRIEGISWVGQPTPIRDLKNVPATAARSLGRAIFVPFSPNYERDWADIDFKSYDLAFMHQTFANALSDSGFKLDGIPLNYFPKYLQIISGDIHRPQTLGPLTYVGAPFHVDFGDEFMPRCLLIENNGKLRSIPCTGPQKRLVEVKSIAELSKQRQLNPGDILKVRLTIAPEQHAEWPELAAKVRAWGVDNGYLIHLVQPVVTALERGSAKAIKAKATKSDEQLIQEYAKSRGLDERTEKTGLTLL
jgi:hypothetical protein